MKKKFTYKSLFFSLALTLAAVGVSIAQTPITDGGFIFTASTTGDINWTNQTGNLLIFAKPASSITLGTPSATYASIRYRIIQTYLRQLFSTKTTPLLCWFSKALQEARSSDRIDRRHRLLFSHL